jgi:carbonic anhydrase/acetyltransferase-like protein (isoleucine patch superfamily)
MHMAITIGKECYIADGATLVGNVKISDRVIILFNAVLRGDLNEIEVGENSNIQDNVTVHVEKTHPARIGKNVSIGHNSVVHGCTIEDNVLIGMGSVIMNGALIRKGSVVAAGSIVTENFVSEENSLLIGSPAKQYRKGPDIEKMAMANAMSYGDLRQKYLGKSFDIRREDDK